MSVVKGTEIATIDVALVSIQTYEQDADEIILDTANHIQVAVQTETEDAVKLVVKGRLIAQKGEQTTITGNQITLTDNVFNDKVVKILQGGTIKTDPVTGEFAGYTPPVVGAKGEDATGKLFRLKAYSSIYNAAGVLTGYECITYPNCKGKPFAFDSEDGVFRSKDYVIDSAPAEGEAPYDMDIIGVDELPVAYNYILTTSEPSDWSTNYTNYYTYDSSTGQYTAVPVGSGAPTWTANTYYKREIA